MTHFGDQVARRRIVDFENQRHASGLLGEASVHGASHGIRCVNVEVDDLWFDGHHIVTGGIRHGVTTIVGQFFGEHVVER